MFKNPRDRTHSHRILPSGMDRVHLKSNESYFESDKVGFAQNATPDWGNRRLVMDEDKLEAIVTVV